METTPMRFPRRLPAALDGVAAPILASLGPLVPPSHAERALTALAGIRTTSAMSVGVEVVLPPHEPACDISVLMPPRSIPGFAVARSPMLADFACVEGAEGSVWWELDTSSPRMPIGAFIREQAGDGFALMRSAAADSTALLDAETALRGVVADCWHGPGRLVGFFPDRDPAPIAAALLPLASGDESTLPRLTARATIAVDPESATVRHLRSACGPGAVSIGADPAGRVAVSWEAAWHDREVAMAEGRWDPMLAALPGLDQDIAAHLLSIQGMHACDSLPPVKVLTGIDHLKVGPGGRLKAYVGAHLLMAT